MLNFGLSAPGTIMGRVSDSVTGNGISGVTLTFNGGTTTTDPTGHYTISGIAAGSQTLTAAAIGYTSTSQTVIVSANGIVTADFVLTQAQVTVDGEVLDSITLAPIVGATVSYDGGGPATTDSVGYYVLQNVLPGTHIVTVSMNGYVSASSEVNVVTGFRATVDFNLTPTTGSTVTFTPIGDAMVKSSNPTTKYGSLGTLRVRDGDPIYHSYMKFNVAGISGPIASATIRLYATDKSNDGGSLYVVDNAWDEATITWSNAPPIAGAPIDSAGPVNTDTWIELGVTSVVTGNGTYSFALASASSTSAYYSSREGTFPPELVLVQGVVSNLPPVVHAGPDQTIALPQEVALTATVSDDGLPASTLTMAWSQSSGPGIVTFVNPTASSTTATFSTAGTYVLLLTASDTTLSASDTVTISVTAAAPVNQAPQVNAGLDQTITALSTTLTGSVTDDGLPTGSTLTRSWSQVSGPGIVTFTPPNAAVTTASFSTTGTYSLRLSASDTALSASDTVTVVVVTTGTTTVVETRVAAKIDDAEEKGSDGSMDLTSGNVDLGTKPSGMRFLLPVPPSAHITRAYVQFTADTARTGTTNLMIEGEASDNALAFGTSKHNIVNRLRTFNHISWTPAGWPTKGVAGLAQQTPDISTIIQEIVDRPGWASGQGLALIVTGTGIRQAVSYDNKPATAPLLHVEYVLP
jgi:PKD repeat protein